MLLILRDLCDEVELELLPKHSHIVLCGKEDTKSILDPPLQLRSDKSNHV